MALRKFHDQGRVKKPTRVAMICPAAGHGVEAVIVSTPRGTTSCISNLILQVANQLSQGLVLLSGCRHIAFGDRRISSCNLSWSGGSNCCYVGL